MQVSKYPISLNKNDKIFVAGHRGMVGSAILRKLTKEGHGNFVLRTSRELDLRNQKNVTDFFDTERPEYVFLAAAKVGGIRANDVYRADFLYDNLMIQSNVIHAAFEFGVKKLLFLGSSCIYPRNCPQPMQESALLTGELEPTNEPYAIAKIAGIKLCDAYRRQHNCNFISVMPTNLYGPNDNYDLNNSHVLPALLRKFIEAKRSGKPSVEIWGSGEPLREFMHADDLADATVYVMKHFNDAGFINIGSGEERSIAQLAALIKKVVKFEGKMVFNTSMPDGTPRKLLDSTKLEALGWKSKITLDAGLREVYKRLDTSFEKATMNANQNNE